MRTDRPPLVESDLPDTWLTQFELWLADARRELETEPTAMVLATAGGDGDTGARTVLLKGVGLDGFRFFTNDGSRKARQLAENPRASLVFPWYASGRQVVVDGRVERLPAADSDAYFDTRPHASRLGALASPQSRVIAGRGELERWFEELAERYPEGSALPRPEWWGGWLVAPDRVEFWQGRENRLHDRLQYRRAGEGWVVERLAP